MIKRGNVNKLFGKDYKFFWRHDTVIGNIYGVVLNRLGMLLLTLARKLIRKGDGNFRDKHYSNCSWCGRSWDKGFGLDFTRSNKGSRCGCLPISCDQQPKV